MLHGRSFHKWGAAKLVDQAVDYFGYVPIDLVKYICTRYVIRKTSVKIESRGSMHITWVSEIVVRYA